MCLVPLLTLGIGGYVYVSDCYRADEQAAAAMVQDGAVGIETSGSVTWFIPEQPTAGLIFYPGGKVEHTAYAAKSSTRHMRRLCEPAPSRALSARW